RERVNDPMETAYFGVHLWKKAVEKAGTAATEELRRALRGLSVGGPEGMGSLGEARVGARRAGRIGEIVPRGRVPQVEGGYASPGPLRPEPFPPGRSEEEWKKFLDGLYKTWGGRWER